MWRQLISAVCVVIFFADMALEARDKHRPQPKPTISEVKFEGCEVTDSVVEYEGCKVSNGICNPKPIRETKSCTCYNPQTSEQFDAATNTVKIFYQCGHKYEPKKETQ